MRSIWKRVNPGFAMMTVAPLLALCFGWEAFFPVAAVSVIGSAICLIGRCLFTHLEVGQLTAALVQDLTLADQDRHDLVLGELREAEGNWFRAELPRARAELRRQQGKSQRAWRTGARWAWRVRYS